MQELDDLKVIVTNSFNQMNEAIKKTTDNLKELTARSTQENTHLNSPTRAETILKLSSPKAVSGMDAELLAKIEKYTQEANEIMKANYLKDIWNFEDLHKDNLAPSYIHRVRNRIVKHIQVVGDSFVLTNSQNDNIDIYA
jgi:hypothetical protein